MRVHLLHSSLDQCYEQESLNVCVDPTRVYLSTAKQQQTRGGSGHLVRLPHPPGRLDQVQGGLSRFAQGVPLQGGSQ